MGACDMLLWDSQETLPPVGHIPNLPHPEHRTRARLDLHRELSAGQLGHVTGLPAGKLYLFSLASLPLLLCSLATASHSPDCAACMGTAPTNCSSSSTWTAGVCWSQSKQAPQRAVITRSGPSLATSSREHQALYRQLCPCAPKRAFRITTPLVQRGKLRHRAGKRLVQGHTGSPWQLGPETRCPSFTCPRCPSFTCPSDRKSRDNSRLCSSMEDDKGGRTQTPAPS